MFCGPCLLGSDLRQRCAQRPRAALDPFKRLTAREREVFLLLAGSRTPKQVAADLGIGQRTVYIHRASRMGKLGGFVGAGPLPDGHGTRTALAIGLTSRRDPAPS